MIFDALEDRSLSGIVAAMLEIDGRVTAADIEAAAHLGHCIKLLAVAERLKQSAPEGASVARLGGDEFALIVPIAKRDLDPVEDWVKETVEKVAQPIEVEIGAIEVTISAGVAVQCLTVVR